MEVDGYAGVEINTLRKLGTTPNCAWMASNKPCSITCPTIMSGDHL